MAKIIVDEKVCKGCGMCVHACPLKIIALDKTRLNAKGYHPAKLMEPDKCVGCKMCMKIGCPAISIKDKKSVIDFTQCVGCKVCSQLCKFDAIEEGK